MTVVGIMETFYNPWGIGGHDALGTRAMFRPGGTGGYGEIAYLIRTEPGATAGAMAEIEKRLTAANAGRVLEFETTPDKKGRWFSGSKIVVTTLTCIIVALVAVTALGLLGLTSWLWRSAPARSDTPRPGGRRGGHPPSLLLENLLLTHGRALLGVIGAYGLNFLLVSRVSDSRWTGSSSRPAWCSL